MRHIHASRFAIAKLAISALATSAGARLITVWDNGGHFVFPASTREPPAIPTGARTDSDQHDLTGTFTNTGTQALYVGGVTVNRLTNATKTKYLYFQIRTSPGHTSATQIQHSC